MNYGFLTPTILRRIRWILVGLFVASLLLINSISPFLPFVMVLITAAYEYKANQIADLDTPGVEWALERFEDDAESGETDPFASLKEQYVNGEISEAEFEDQLDRLLGSESSEEEQTEARNHREKEQSK